jgi:ectoine hydroxylase-related dioxygenase (phytanoyl-CoA dioxygenase family)
MNKDDINFFMDNGYFILKNAVDKSFCDIVFKNTKNVLNKAYGSDYENKYYHIKLIGRNPHITDFMNTHNLSYNFKKDKNDILNQVAGTNITNRTSGGYTISSFKSGHNEKNWHLDGWAHHYLSQSMHSTCVIAYTDTVEGTWVAPESIKLLTEFFYNNNFMLHCENFLEFAPLLRHIINKCNDIRQVSLEQGDMLITHPFLVHAANFNKTQDIRVITNMMLMKEIDLKNPISLVELRIQKDLEELKLDINKYHLDTSKVLPKYEPIVGRPNHDNQYKLLKNQLIHLQKNNIINDKDQIDGVNIMKNNFNETNNEELDNYNKNIYKKVKERFYMRLK